MSAPGGTAPSPVSARQAAAYGLPGLPLAFVALPLYVVMPNHYARHFGVSVAVLGVLLLATRLFDALIDPLLGRWIDRLFARSPGQVLRAALAGCVALAAGFALLFHPPAAADSGAMLLAWAAAALMLSFAAYSAVSVAHQSWGARLGGDEVQRSRVVAWREGLALVGVLAGSVLPLLAGLDVTAVTLAAGLALGMWTWHLSARPAPAAAPASPRATGAALMLPWTRPGFRRLLAVFLLNGIASAVPATLVLFFVQDRLQASARMEPAFLALYFLSAAAALPLWVALVRRIGLARSWLAGMLLAVVTFAGAASLGAGDESAFLVVCALSGLALGADLAVPGALLAGVIAQAGDAGRHEGSYFGWWNFASKLNLAASAGLALPLLGLAGYAPGAREPAALWALTLAYCLLPCLLKLGAAALLYTHLIRPGAPR